MGDRTCSLSGCGKGQYARSLCKKHYDAWRTSPDAVGVKRVYRTRMRTHCAKGHEFTPENTYVKPTGKRMCKQCKADHYQRFKESGQKRESQLRHKYGISVEQWNHMFRAQRGRCAICGKEAERLVVDHCHQTGGVRGLLCYGCNLGIGLLGDQPETVVRAVVYLQVFGNLRA